MILQRSFARGTLYFALLSFSSLCFSDTFFLSDGKAITGKITGESKGIVRILTRQGEIRINRSEILRIDIERPSKKPDAPAEKIELRSQGVQDYLNWRGDLKTPKIVMFASLFGMALSGAGIIVAAGMPDKKSDPFASPTKNQMMTAAILCGVISSLGAIWSLELKANLHQQGRERGYIARLNVLPRIDSHYRLSGLGLSFGVFY